MNKSSKNSRQLELRATNETISQMTKQIDENSGFIKGNLVKIWGENQAEYFSNPARLVNKPEDGNEGNGDRSKLISSSIESQRKSSTKQSHKQQTQTVTASNQQNKGLYAFAIWDNIREDTKRKLRNFNLEKELQETMDTFLRNQKSLIEHTTISLPHTSSIEMDLGDEADYEDDELKISLLENSSNLKSIKALRNEIELMYRSSKLNEQRVNILRNDEDSFDHIAELKSIGKDSISNYLPPIYLTEIEQTAPSLKASEVNITSPIMRHEYRKQIELKQTEKNRPVDFLLIKNVDHKIKSARNVKLNYLSEKPTSEYLRETDEKSKSREGISSSLVLYDESIAKSLKDAEKKPPVTAPPLSLNALMEYKNAIKAPGDGDFSHGKPMLYKFT